MSFSVINMYREARWMGEEWPHHDGWLVSPEWDISGALPAAGRGKKNVRVLVRVLVATH
jgi:hypothetical protein